MENKPAKRHEPVRASDTRHNVSSTPTPWKHEGIEIIGAEGTKDGRPVCQMVQGTTSPASKLERASKDWEIGMANADLIVRAVNAHDMLVKACLEAAETISAIGNESGGVYPVLNQLMDAIAKAEAH